MCVSIPYRFNERRHLMYVHANIEVSIPYRFNESVSLKGEVKVVGRFNSL